MSLHLSKCHIVGNHMSRLIYFIYLYFVVVCEDGPGNDCTSPNIRDFVCKHRDVALQLCPKTCNLCGKQLSSSYSSSL